MNPVRLSLLLSAFAALASGCAPDNSIDGIDAVGGYGGAAAGGAGTAGAAASATGGFAVGGSSAGSSGTAGSGTAGSSAGASSAGASGAAGAAGGGMNGGAGSGTGGSSGAGAAGASGSGGGAMNGGAGPGGPSRCPVAGTTLCDGFEGPAPGEATSDWTILKSGTDTMTVDTTKFYRGGKSMHFTGTTQTYIVEKKTFTGTTKATNNTFWGRYFIFGNAANAAAYPQGHVVFGALANAMNGGDQFNFVGGSRGKLQAEIRITSDVYTDDMRMPAAADPDFPSMADGWQCWEWHVQADDSFSFYINGTEVQEMKITAGRAAMSGGNFSPMPIFGGLYLGWRSFSAGAAISGWIDEVAIGPERITCNN